MKNSGKKLLLRTPLEPVESGGDVNTSVGLFLGLRQQMLWCY